VMTLSGLQGYLPVVSLFKRDLLYTVQSCAIVDKTSADIAHCAVPLR